MSDALSNSTRIPPVFEVEEATASLTNQILYFGHFNQYFYQWGNPWTYTVGVLKYPVSRCHPFGQ
jgi:hypothetical protein